jgi:NAD(P)-dependent dehydrogenase (short-subunit alcohol dehydrogenase family)
VDLIKKEGGDAVAAKGDVSKAKDCENMVALAEKTYGKMNILFNNAGIMHPDDNAAHDTEEKIWDLTFNVNAKGVFFGCKCFPV